MSPAPKVSLNEETAEWLDERYPDAMSDAEKIRMAISDLRNSERIRREAIKAVERERRAVGGDEPETSTDDGSSEDADSSEE